MEERERSVAGPQPVDSRLGSGTEPSLWADTAHDDGRGGEVSVRAPSGRPNVLERRGQVLFVIGCVAIGCFAIGYAVGRGTRTRGADDAADEGPSPCAPRAVHQLIVYYFHPAERSETCRKLEAAAQAAIRTSFPSHVALEEIVWSTVDLAEAGSRGYGDRYDLKGSALVLVSTFEGRELAHRILDRAAHLLDDEAAFTTYVRTQVIEALEEHAPGDG